MIKVLNLYAGIGGNRKLWENVEVTAIENNEKTANIYQDFFPDDVVLITDAHKYILYNHQQYDFIWSSPPCQTHSKARWWGLNRGNYPPVYPDMRLYEEIIFLKHHFKGKWVVENVKSYYKPLIKPYECGRHYFWSNFVIPKKHFKGFSNKDNVNDLQKASGFDISKYKLSTRRVQVLRNVVNPKLGLHVFDCAFKEKQVKLL